MLSKEDWMFIEAQLRQGVYQKDIAAKLGVHPRSIRRAVARGGAPNGKLGRPRKSKLDPYKPLVDKLLGEGVWNGAVIFEVLKKQGYDGRMSILGDYIRPKRALRPSRATVRFETGPGEQLQHDWGEIRTIVAGERVRVCFSVNTLSFSRRFHFWCTDSQDAEHTYEGIIRAFEYLGGVTACVLVDNQGALVSGRSGGVVRFHPRFVDLALRYGFAPKACRPYRARTKGKDERMVGYIKQNFFQRYQAFESFAHLNNLARDWLREVADPRFHGTVREVVGDRFEKERPHLRPLPDVRYDTAYHERRRVSWDGYIEVRGNRYSVPDPLCGSVVAIRLTLEDELSVYNDTTLVASHRLRPATDGWVSVPHHHAELWAKTLNVQTRDLAVYEEAGQWS
jgi:transposase